MFHFGRQNPQNQDAVPSPHSDDSRSSVTDKERNHDAAPLLSADGLRQAFRRRKILIVAAITCAVLLALGLGLGLGLGLTQDRSANGSGHKGPNVLVIMADDQDMLLDSMSVMPQVNKLIADEGVFYHKHFCTVAWCCPSRANFLTGRAAHNTNITSGSLPYGGWPKFLNEGLNDKYLPVWIKQAGIRTYYVGKLLNGFKKRHLASGLYPNAWTMSSFLIDPWTYFYYDSVWSNDNGGSEKFKGEHTTDVTQRKALAMLDDAAAAKNQFFMMVAPVAPHQDLQHGVEPPPVPAKYKGVFDNRTAPRTENFNPDVPSGASWVRNLPKLSSRKLEVCDKTYADRLGNIAAIDDMVATLIQRLEDHGLLDNTFVVYTSDNGFHIGNHRLAPGKRCPYEEDINIPLLIRGPGVAKGVNSTITNSHTDMAPTILKMLEVPQQADFDGAPIAYTDTELATSMKSELVNVEFWNAAQTPIGVKHHEYYNNTYKALRLMTSNNQANGAAGESFFYSTWCTGQREFYDMRTDAQQMHNRLAEHPTGVSRSYYGRSEDELFHRLDALLMVTKSCKMDSCRDPWGALFPGGEVTDISGAMNETYDAFFLRQPKVEFASCVKGHVVAEEGPQVFNVFSR